jgi:outer membrane protein TolC
MRYIVALIWASLLFAAPPSISLENFYTKVVKNLRIDAQQKLGNDAATLLLLAHRLHRFADLHLNASYTRTKAKLLPNDFQTTDIALTDTIDLFNKNFAAAQKLRLEIQANKLLSSAQKQMLFISLAQMAAQYAATDSLLQLQNKLLNTQERLAKKIAAAVKQGAMPRISLERFLNMLALMKVQIADMKSTQKLMQERFFLLSDTRQIPRLNAANPHTTLSEFLHNNPQLQLLTNAVSRSTLHTTSLQKAWLPKLQLSLLRQYNNDPTANGDNYGFCAGVQFHFDTANSDALQAAKLQTLRLREKHITLLIQEKIRFLKLMQTYRQTTHTIKLLRPSMQRAQKIATAMQTAYLKHFTGYTAYTQSLQDLLRIQKDFYTALYQNFSTAAILNHLSRRLFDE